MSIDFSFVSQKLIKQQIPRPSLGAISGHAAGEPFDKLVYKEICDKYPNSTFRHYEFLNHLYLSNPKATTATARHNLIEFKALRHLLNRGKSPTQNWTQSKQFTEKQNDTADIIFQLEGEPLCIIDVKTHDIEKSSQPPNIISAKKLAEMCRLMIKSNQYDSHRIIYIGLGWKLEDANLVCHEISIKDLFKTDPNELYINWSAANQIQFHVKSLPQDYQFGVESWCKSFLKSYVTQANKRISHMVKEFIEPYKID